MLNQLFSISNKGIRKTIKILGLKITYKSSSLIIQEKDNEIIRCKKLLNALAKPSDCPVAKGGLRNDQLANIYLLKDLKRICDEHNIPYWIDFGTLLGAVRHKGFIPWDTDIDVSMLREDYLKIIPILKKEYDNSEFIVRETTKTMHFQLRVRNIEDNNIGLDIFPIDFYPKENLSEDEKIEIDSRIRVAQKALRKKLKSNEWKDIKNIRERIKDLNKKIIFKSKNVENKSLFYGIDYPLPHKNLVRNYDEIFPLKQIEFEGELYPCPNNSDKHLSYFYSKNYMQFPLTLRPMDRMVEYIDSL